MPKPRRTRQVFISWSGRRSLAVAEALCDFIPRVIPELKDRLFVSTGIEKGARWSDEIAWHLEEADAGILCLTAEGLNSSWLHFEAGALTKGLDSTRARRGEPGGASSSSRIFTYLHGIAANALEGPLSQYQSTAANRDDTWRLMNTLHDLFATARSELRSARRRFDERWPELERDLRRNAVLVADIVPEIDSWFQRKTFVESLDECTDEDWIARYDYARDTLRGDLFFPQESSLLYAFLSGNARYRVEASLSMVHYAAADDLKRLIPSYQPNDQTDGLGGASGKHFPSAAWLRCIAGP